MNTFDLLPIGTVVMLQGGEKRLMIYGVKQTDETTGKEYDYLGVIYPEGNIGVDGHYFFNSEDIEKVYFIGYNDAERQEFLNNLAKFYEQNQE